MLIPISDFEAITLSVEDVLKTPFAITVSLLLELTRGTLGVH